MLGGGGYVTFGGTLTFSQTGITSVPTNAITGTATLIANGATNLGDVLSGSGGLTLFGGSSTLSLTAADTYGGSTIVNGGVLSLTGPLVRWLGPASLSSMPAAP